MYKGVNKEVNINEATLCFQIVNTIQPIWKSKQNMYVQGKSSANLDDIKK